MSKSHLEHQGNDSVVSEITEKTFVFNDQLFFHEPVNTYLIELEKNVLLIDIPAYSCETHKFITGFHKPPICILTHGPCGIADGTNWQEQIALKIYMHAADLKNPWLNLAPDFLFKDTIEINEQIKIIHTPGHSPGSVCVLDYHTGSLFSGDTCQADLKGNIVDFTKNENPRQENTAQRLDSCKGLLNYNFENIFPFHYSFIKKNAKKQLDFFLKTIQYQ